MGAAELASYYVTPEEYLAAELLSDQKHEYVDGIVYPLHGINKSMAGTRNAHARITGNIFGTLLYQLRNHRCEPFSSDTKVRIQKGESKFFYYPDVIVDCGNSPDESYFAEEPGVIFEVLSKETERVDRLEKWDNYRTLSSLKVYVLVDQYKLAVTIHRRTQDGWKTELLTQGTDVLELPTVGCSLPLATIYERTQLLR